MSAMTADEIDWQRWQPTQRATLMFVRERAKLLLIRKKRGLGAGKINGPGGRVEDGESAADCAVRETEEELGVTPIDPEVRGRHRFQFVDGLALEVFVFVANRFVGEPRETDEAVPMWTPQDRIPYDEMWEDDRVWIPLLLHGHCFDGRYLFDGERMLYHHIDVTDDPPQP